MALGPGQSAPLVSHGRSDAGEKKERKEEIESSDGSKNPIEIAGLRIDNSCGWTSHLLLIMKLRKKILNFRDIIDLPPYNGSDPINELVTGTVHDLHKLYPKVVPSIPMSEMNEIPLHKGLGHFYNALKSVGDSWAENHKWLSKFNTKRDSNTENIDLEQLGEKVLVKLDDMIKLARELFDVLDEEAQTNKESSQYSEFGDVLNESYSDNKASCCFSPETPTSVLRGLTSSMKIAEFAELSYSTPLLWPLRIQAVGKLKPIDVKRLSFHMFPYATGQDSIPANKKSKTVREMENDSEVPVAGINEEFKENRPANGTSSPNTNFDKMTSIRNAIDNSGASSKPTSPNGLSPTFVARESDKIQEAKCISKEGVTGTNEEPKDCKSMNGSARILNINSSVVTGNNRCSKNNSAPPKPTAPSVPPPMLLAEGPPVLSPPSPSPSTMMPLNVSAAPTPSHSILQQNVTTAPSPPPIMPSKGSVPLPLPPMPVMKGVAPPPPPPLGSAKALRPKKANTKLKRSTQMGNMYRLLKGKVEGSSIDGKSLQGRKSNIGGATSGKQGMADALAEMTKRSAYFQQIEEDVKKHEKSILEVKAAINSFQTKDMSELLKFHKYVELHLEELTDETQVLARFDGFPTKKLETLRGATALFSKLDAIAANLERWKIVAPLGQQLDRVESYFNKIKVEVDALERSKDEESKKYQSYNIHFDFNLLVRIKESMVDVSSSCMELALKEKREAKVAAANRETGMKTDDQSKGYIKMLWRAFQLAFKVYTFAGGQDDRADILSRELANEIETNSQN